MKRESDKFAGHFMKIRDSDETYILLYSACVVCEFVYLFICIYNNRNKFNRNILFYLVKE